MSVQPITESKLKSGELTLKTDAAPTATSFACQATNVRIVPKHDDEGDPIETLCGSTLGAETKRTDSLVIEAIQDFTDPDGFVAYSWLNDRDWVTFSWTPAGATGPTYAGKVQVRALEVGGAVNRRITTEAEWPATGAAGGSVDYTPAGP